MFLSSGRFGLQVGSAYHLSRRWNVLGEVAFPVTNQKSSLADEKFFRINGEVQRLLHADNPYRYVAFQAGFVSRRFTDTAGGLFVAAKNDTSGFSYTDATIHSPVFTNTLKIGRKVFLGQRAYLDLFAGMGVRFIFTSYKANNLSPTPVVRRVDKIFPAPDPAWECNCTLARFNPAAGVRIGVRL
jgi:hypothetical protein